MKTRTNISTAAAKAKVDAAMGRVVVREPGYAHILLGMDIVPSESHETFATNGKAVFYNPSFVGTLSDDEIVGVLCHEAEHVFRLHPWRRQARDPQAWNIATDYSINESLESGKIVLPKGCLRDRQYDNMAEEAIYAKLPKGGGGGGSNPGGQPGQPGGQPGGTPQPGQGKPGNNPVPTGEVEDYPGTEAEKNEAEEMAKVQVIRAATMAKQCGRLPANWESMVDSIKHPPVNWREELRNVLSQLANDDYSYRRPNRRYHDSPFVLPSLRSERCGTIVVAIDTSGSIGQNEFTVFMGALSDILSSMKPTTVIVCQCDSRIADWQEFEGVDSLDVGKLTIKGGGGTDFCPPFERIASEGITPDGMVYLTDACGTFPDSEPDYPVVWAVTTDAAVPWGNRVHIDINS